MFRTRAILTVSVLALPLAAGAQARRAPTTPAERPVASATELLNRRRELDLSPRQVARLDSIERAQFAQRRAFAQQLQKQRDSVCANRRPCRLSEEEREKFREQLNSGRGNRESLWRSDSTGRVLAMSLLDSTQRGRVQGWRQGRARMARGFARREMGARALGGRGMGGPGMGARGMRFGPGRGFMGPQGLRRRDFEGPRMRQRDFPDQMGPGFGPRGRFQEPGDMGARPRLRRPQLNDSGPPSPPRPPADSLPPAER